MIRGVVRDYDWGSRDAIAELLGHEPPGHPEAEYWLGGHPSAPSLLVERGVRLDELVACEPEWVIGPHMAARFGAMPYLLKVLAAARPLSIQAHPSLDQAKTGFTRENEAGIAITAPNRNYRDDNHKPELICALTPFEAKCGFRPVSESRRLVDLLALPALAELADRLADADADPGAEAMRLADAVGWLLGLPADRGAAMSAALAERAEAAGPELRAEFGREMTWSIRIADAFPGDVGVVVALLLNHVSLAPGQAIFLGAGNLHSYLQGVGIELMASSDNVLRGGLTTKHVDVAELLRVVDCSPGAAPVQTARGPVHRFDAPVPEFSLTRLDSTEAAIGELVYEPLGPDIVLVTSGELVLDGAGRRLRLPAGSAGLVGHGDGRYRIVDAAPGHTVAWRAAVGTG